MRGIQGVIRFLGWGRACLFVTCASLCLTSAASTANQGQAREISVVPSDVRRAEGFDASQSAGLFIGVTTFADPRLAEVPYAVDDAVDLAYLFAVELELIKPDKVTLAITGDPRKEASVKRLRALLGAGASQQTPNMTDIYRMLGDLPVETGPKGLFILSVATHGFSDQGTDFIVAADSRRRRIARTGIPVAEIFDDVSRARSPRRIVLIDACRERLSVETRAGGSDPDSKMGEGFAEAISKVEGQVVLSGSTLGGYSYDDHELKNGVFSAGIIDGLMGRATPNDEGFITPVGLAEYVNERVLRWVAANRPDRESGTKGIESRLSGNAARMPLSMATDQRERFKSERARARHLVEVLRKSSDDDYVTGTMIEDISALATSADPRALEPLLERLEELEDQGPSYSRELADWWNTEGQGEYIDAIPLKVDIEPSSRTLAVGQSQMFTIGANRSMDKEKLSWQAVPKEFVRVQEISAEESRQRIRITAEKEGTVTLRIVDANNVPRAEAVLYIVLMEKPSLRYPVASLAATTALGIYTLFLNSDRSDKLTEWNDCRTETGLPCDDLGEDYNSALDRTRIVGAATAAGAILSTYLWIRYVNNKKDYEQALDVSFGSRIRLDIGPDRVGVVCSF